MLGYIILLLYNSNNNMVANLYLTLKVLDNDI
jgi:hypothetical protein